MDAFLAHQRLTAAATRAAQPIATRCHRHINARPLVLCCYHLAGDPGALVGIIWGTDSSAPVVDVIGEPRDRDLRFRGLERLARGINLYFNDFRARTAVVDRYGQPKVGREGDTIAVAVDAPQLVVPNGATADWLTVLARSAVWLRTDGEYAVDPALPLFGRHLTHLTGQRAIPGSTNIVAATELLDTHWATGQTDYEDASLTTLLSWIDPEWLIPAWFVAWRRPSDACDAARMAELLPSAGPVSDPDWDIQTLEPAIANFNSDRRAGRPVGESLTVLRSGVASALMPAWTATWRAIQLVRQLPQAATVSIRWEDDRRAWTQHLERDDGGRAYFRRHRTAVQSARLLGAAEDAVGHLEVTMALDDPLVMARHIAAGDAIEATVMKRNDSHFLLGPTGRRRARPIVMVAPDDPVLQPVGTELVWAPDTRVRGVISRLPLEPGDGLEITITAGMRTGAMPMPGERGIFTTLIPPTRFPRTLPDTVPWTHTIACPPDSRTNIE